MSGTALVYNLFSECRLGESHEGLCILDPSSLSEIWTVVQAILVAMLVKGALTVITFGIKVPAGIFIPSLGVGACAGRIVGIFMQWAQYRNPDSAFFAACGGNLDCESLPVFSQMLLIYITKVSFLGYMPWLVPLLRFPESL